jgi:predicted aconitase
MNNTVLVVTVIAVLSSSLAIVVSAITIGKTLIAITNAINTMNLQTSDAVKTLASQFQVHTTEASGKFEMLEYKVHSLDQKIDHKANRLLEQLKEMGAKVFQVEGFISKAHGYKIRTHVEGEN